MSKRLLGRGRVDIEVRHRVRDVGVDHPHEFAKNYIDRDGLQVGPQYEYRCINCGKSAKNETIAKRLIANDRCPKEAA